MSRDIAIIIGDKAVTGWLKVSVSRTMEALSGSFSVDLTTSTPEVVDMIRPGAYVQISILDGTRSAQLMEGYIDTRTTQSTGSGVSISISGRDKTADLVDCAAVVTSSTWTSATVKKICDDILKPFGLICFDYSGATDPLIDFTPQADETAYRIIEKACRSKGILALTDSWGNLVLMNGDGKTRARENLERGVNLIECNENHDIKDRFSKYIVKGSATATGTGWNAGSSTLQATSLDTQIDRYRPTIIHSESKPTSASIQRRAAWEAQVRAGRSKTYECKVQGWIQGTIETTSEFRPWEINQSIHLKDDALSVDSDFIITGVNFTRDDGGEVTVLSLKHPDTYKPDPDGGLDV